MPADALRRVIVVGCATVQNRMIVQKLYVARLEIHLETECFRVTVEKVKCFFLEVG